MDRWPLVEIFSRKTKFCYLFISIWVRTGSQRSWFCTLFVLTHFSAPTHQQQPRNQPPPPQQYAPPPQEADKFAGKGVGLFFFIIIKNRESFTEWWKKLYVMICFPWQEIRPVKLTLITRCNEFTLIIITSLTCSPYWYVMRCEIWSHMGWPYVTVQWKQSALTFFSYLPESQI